MRKILRNRAGQRLRLMPAGTYTMGDAEEDNARPHRCVIEQPFFIGETPVTQGQYASIMGSKPWEGVDYAGAGPNVAATCMTYDDACEFCARLTKVHGRLYRLPTEAEWEYACRAGTKQILGESELVEFAWFDKNLSGDASIGVREVSQKKPNRWGLFDMLGNVYEMCSDQWTFGYPVPAAARPFSTHRPAMHVLRGGAWGSHDLQCHPAHRLGNLRYYATNDVGFRVVAELRPRATTLRTSAKRRSRRLELSS